MNKRMEDLERKGGFVAWNYIMEADKCRVNEWEQRKLDDVAEFSKGNGYSKGDLIEVGTPIILYGRLYTKYETSISDVDTYVEAKEGSVYSKGGEVIVPASGETAEDIARAATVDKSGILLGGDLNVVMPNKDINSAFMAISISNGNSQRELAKKAQGKSVVHIHNEEIRNLIVPFPNKVEQDKIVDYFTNLDHLITLHQWKHYRIKKIINSAWEQRKVGDITKELSEYAKLNSGLPLLTSARTGLMYQSDYRGNSTTDNENTLFSIVPLNACTYRHMSDDSTFHINVNTLEKGLVSKEYPVFVENESDLRFVVQYINSSDSFTKFCTEQKKGGTRTRLYYKTLCEYKMLIPSLNEQHIIADYFDNLDYLITLHQQKYKSLKKLKKFMVKNMFLQVKCKNIEKDR